jgi:hypothetical protein
LSDRYVYGRPNQGDDVEVEGIPGIASELAPRWSDEAVTVVMSEGGRFVSHCWSPKMAIAYRLSQVEERLEEILAPRVSRACSLGDGEHILSIARELVTRGRRVRSSARHTEAGT